MGDKTDLQSGVLNERIEQGLRAALAPALQPKSGTPPRFAKALEYTVFPGGARVRPRLALAVAGACGDSTPRVSEAAACAIELLHCASLVHDDLPCFDNASVRRGRPSVHTAFGRRLAVLAGDALIVEAFRYLGEVVGADRVERLPALTSIVAAAVAAPHGIAAGQAWECEPKVCLEDYHRAKTSALFVAATGAGAAAAGWDPKPWQELGAKIGDAYQVADDLSDALGDEETLGKPTGQDSALHRPSAVEAFGVAGAGERLKQLLADALDSIPRSPGEAALKQLIVAESQRFMPKLAGRRAA